MANLIYGLNFDVLFLMVVIASMVTMFSTELMAIVPIATRFNNNKTRINVLSYIVPVWEVVGTFFVLWLVDMENIIPILMPAISYALFPLFATFIFFLVVRNSFIIYAEFVWHENKYFNERKLYVIYTVATFIMGIMALSILAAISSGYGVHLYGFGVYSSKPYSSSYTNFGVFYSHLGVIGFIIGALIMANGVGMVFYKLTDRKTAMGKFLPLILVIIGLAIFMPSYYSITTKDYMVNNAYIIIPIVLALIIPVLYIFKSTTYLASYKPFIIILSIISIAFLELRVYPYVFGNANIVVYVPAVLTDSPMEYLAFIISAIGGTWLVLMMIYYAYVSNHRIAKLIPPTSTANKTAKTTVQTKQ
jgi:cytochrome d ubiquinol oxidase subunit II